MRMIINTSSHAEDNVSTVERDRSHEQDETIVNKAFDRDEHHSQAAEFAPSHHHQGRFAQSKRHKGPGMMFAKRFSARMIAASGIVGITAIAVSAGVNTADVATAPNKTDRFATVAERLCADQNWPNISPGCITWQSATPGPRKVRFVTQKTTDTDNNVTVLSRTKVTQIAQR
ncbi:hypothetical protein [Amorphus coralli]|uniref:hypothetical protein n=1 Tax=Amorphus coralli TaxID=340680 RepID=UPI0012EC15AF|nr:hypothetical protein [Amorphus coralli]